jgi:DNA invertase Pin-like site-specific DNA recombinase
MRVAIYVRVSRADLTAENQRLKLIEYATLKGWDYEVFEEIESTRKTRPIKERVLQMLRDGKLDGVLIYKLDRWARSLQELIMNVTEITNRGKQFTVLTQPFDTTSSAGMLMMQILGAFAEFEREIIRERTIAGLDRATAIGKVKGRHPKDCGCGKKLENGKSHNGFIVPIRNENNKFVGWKNNKNLEFHENFMDFYKEEKNRILRARERAKEKPMKDECENCGLKNVKLERHHPDYNYPMVFKTLCLKCHKFIEKQTPPIRPIKYPSEVEV